MARFTDFFSEIAAAAVDIRKACLYCCYAHKEPGMLSMLRHYGIGYTLAEVAACRDL